MIHVPWQFYLSWRGTNTGTIVGSESVAKHDDVIKWKHFPRYWPFVRGIHRSPVNSPHNGQWRGALFSLICAWINGWVNNGDAGDLRRHRAHYDVIVMKSAKRNWISKTKPGINSSRSLHFNSQYMGKKFALDNYGFSLRLGMFFGGDTYWDTCRWQICEQCFIGVLYSCMPFTHWDRDQMEATSQTTFLKAFSWMKMFEFQSKFHWSVFVRVQLTIFQHWFR